MNPTGNQSVTQVHRKLKTGQHESHWKPECTSGQHESHWKPECKSGQHESHWKPECNSGTQKTKDWATQIPLETRV